MIARLYKLISKEDFLTLNQQKALINSGKATKIFCVLNLPFHNVNHISLKNGLIMKLPCSIGTVELTQYATPDQILDSDGIKSLIAQHRLTFITEKGCKEANDFESRLRAKKEVTDIANDITTEEEMKSTTDNTDGASESINDNLAGKSMSELKKMCKEKGIATSFASKKETLLQMLRTVAASL